MTMRTLMAFPVITALGLAALRHASEPLDACVLLLTFVAVGTAMLGYPRRP